MIHDASLASSSIKLFFCGDVMTGRGIDQILPHSVNPKLYESYVKDARGYLDLAERKNGTIQQPVSYSYIWGDALAIWREMAATLKIINLETSLTVYDKPWLDKGINYRMHPKNVEVLTTAGIDFCSLANNHTLDWERPGLIETMEVLQESNIIFGGAGRNANEAGEPGIFSVTNGRVIVLAYGAQSSGIPELWGAQEQLSGINLLPVKINAAVELIQSQVASVKQKNDIVVFSIHWGANWGYDIPHNHRKLAHELIDKAGVDIIHGHSSHHPLGIEVYHEKLIIYGAGDFINDYEGIRGYEKYRGDLCLMYFPMINQATGQLISMKIVPMKIKNFKLNTVDGSDALWLKNMLNREGRQLGTQIKLDANNGMDLEWEYK